MKVYTDSEGRILAVGATDDVSLIEQTIADDEQNPFIGWSDAKIMCYRVTVGDDGHVTMMTPYVPSNIIDKISQMQTLIGYAVSSVDELILTQADMLFDMCLLEMGIDATEFFDDFSLEEEETENE